MTDLTPPPQVWPSLRARDARTLIAFLVEAFGFEETAVFGDGDVVHHAELAWPPGGGIMLGSAPANAAGTPKAPSTTNNTNTTGNTNATNGTNGTNDDQDPWPLQPGTFGAYAVTDEPDALFARATAAGATVLRPPSDTEYGSREFAVLDPEGNLWSFGTFRGEPRKH